MLQLLNNASLLDIMAAAVRSGCAQLVNTGAGSVTRAILQANASVALWMQWLTMRVLLTTRAAGSEGADLDSWVADYGLARLPAVAATGMVSLWRNAADLPATVAPGGQVRTGDGSQLFAIVADSTNPAWVAAAGLYQLSPGQAAIAVPVAAVAAGTGGNVQPGTITLLASPLPGVDGVSNPLATTGGLDPESDAALRTRAGAYFASLSRATRLAVQAAAMGVQQGLSVLVLENTPQTAQFLVVVDDGSGHPPASLLQSVYAAVDATRPIGTTFAVRAPAVVGAAVSVTLATAPGADHAGLTVAVASAIAAMVNALPIGAPLPVTRLAAVAYNVSADILNVSVLLNGGGADLAPGPAGVVRAAGVAVA